MLEESGTLNRRNAKISYSRDKIWQRVKVCPLGLFVYTVLLSGVSACGGSGGGGDDGRTTDTALRIIHGSIDATPIRASVEDIVLSDVRYASASEYVRVPEGPHALKVERSDGSEVSTLNVELEARTEYTLFVHGTIGDQDFRLRLISEPIGRPDEGKCFVQILNSYSGAISVAAGDIVLTPVRFGSSSGFIEFPAGPTSFQIRDDENASLGGLSLELPDRGEVTLHITGKKRLGVSFLRSHVDFD